MASKEGSSKRRRLWRFFHDPKATGLRKAFRPVVGFVVDNIPDLGAFIYVDGVLIAVFFFFGEGRAQAAAPYLRSSWWAMVGIIFSFLPSYLDRNPSQTFVGAANALYRAFFNRRPRRPPARQSRAQARRLDTTWYNGGKLLCVLQAVAPG